MSISKQQCREISEAIESQVAAILEEHGLAIEPNSTRSKYGEGYEIKIVASTVRTNDRGINLDSTDAKAFIRNAWLHNIGDAEADLGIVYQDNDGTEWQMVGYNPRAPKFPFIIKNMQTGRLHKGTEGHAKYLPSWRKDLPMVGHLNETLAPR